MNEVWKPVPGFETKYAVSNLGNVRNRYKFMKVNGDPSGYLYFYGYKDGRTIQFNLKQLMDKLFDNHVYTTYMRDPDEIWAPIANYEGYYEISNLGNVKSCERTRKGKHNTTCVVREKLKTPCPDQDGYLVVTLYKDSANETVRVHRLVAQAFIANPENKPQVNHIDGDKRNNIVNNLEWVTNIENIRHSIAKGLRDYSKIVEKSRQVNCKPVICVETGYKYASIQSLITELGISYDTFHTFIDSNTDWNGYHYKYIKEDT